MNRGLRGEDAEYTFLEKISLRTWCQVTGPFHIWYHDVGEYYQVEVECRILDGCGEIRRATLHLTADKGEYGQVVAWRETYCRGSLHFIDSRHFNISDYDITFYRTDTTPVTDEDEPNMKKWFGELVCNCPDQKEEENNDIDPE